MGVYVDPLRSCSPTKQWRWKESAHLIADSLEELHNFARRLGLRREWFQPKSSPHYDLTAARYARALSLGAVVLDRVEFVTVMRRLREEFASSET